ncbi:MAG: DUF481 domain-containing protein [Cyclonatronaceae bacterium]
MYRYTLFLLIPLLLPFAADAQVLNVERFRSDADTADVWIGELKFDFSLSKQNTTVMALGNETNLAHFTRNHVYYFLNQINLVMVDEKSLVSDGYFHIRGTYNRRKTWSPETFLQFQYNLNWGLKRRALAGATMRYKYLDTPAIRGSVSTGLMIENEFWRESDEPSVEKTLLKSTTSLLIRGRLTEQAEMVMIGYYQAPPASFFKPRITGDAKLNLKISSNLTFTTQFVLTYDADPLIDVTKVVYRLTNGIVISI